MTATVEKNRDLLPALLEARAGSVNDSLTPLRREAAEAFAKLGFPSPDHEEWRYTNTLPITRAEYAMPAEQAELDLSSVLLAEEASAELVFIDGRFAPWLSKIPTLRSSALGPLSVLGQQRSFIDRIGSAADYRAHAFAALNTGMIEDAAVVNLGEGVVLEKPVHVIWAVSDEAGAIVSTARTLVFAGVNARASVVETFVGSDGAYLTNSVTELIAGDGAHIDYYKMERESEKASHISLLASRVGRDASVTTHTISLGGAVVRNELHALLEGEGGECHLDGLYLLRGEQKVDNHTVIDHARPHTTSSELYKAILDGKSNGIFDGKIIVRPGAQKTSSRQTNRNLVLSSEARADSKPQLEIYADDVKCTHGSTIGQLDAESLFYLRSRGVGETQARNILTYAFASEVVERIRIPVLREQLQRDILQRVPFERGESQ
jgi:Fe-S cluster assembly protein SufD